MHRENAIFGLPISISTLKNPKMEAEFTDLIECANIVSHGNKLSQVFKTENRSILIKWGLIGGQAAIRRSRHYYRSRLFSFLANFKHSRRTSESPQNTYKALTPIKCQSHIK
jgi:hypothetical protein